MPRPSADPSTALPGVVWSVGDVASALGLPASTVRTWERRYGLSPSVRTAGGHRRYDTADVERMRLMRQLVEQGVAPSEAARTVLRSDLLQAAAAVIQLEGPEQWAIDMVRAGRVLDARRIRVMLHELVDARGVAGSWDDYLAPMLRRLGEDWACGSLGVESEHLVSDVLLTMLRTRVESLAADDRPPAIIMASAEDDQHSLPVVALQAALAEAGVEAHVFGQRLPAAALATVVARSQPRAVFVWASMPRPTGDRLHRVLTALSTKTRIVLGGPGWETTPIAQARHAPTLSSALAALSAEAAY